MPLRLIRKLGRRLLSTFAAKEEEKHASPSAPRHHAPTAPQGSASHAGGPAHRAKPVHPARPHAASRPPAAPEEPWAPQRFEVPPAEGKVRFHDLGLQPEIMHAIHDLGFSYCMPVQAECLPPALKGQNVTGRAQTGTGKTAAFLVTILSRFLKSPNPAGRPQGAPRALILAPTRELVAQIASDAHDLGKYCPFQCLAVYGGMDFKRQQHALEHGSVEIIVATPGRLLDFAARGHLNLGQVEVLVIDEADRMLDMGFIPDMRRIMRRLPPNDRRQSMLFSATLSEEVMRLASQWMSQPVVVEIEPEQVTAEGIEPIVYTVTSRDKAKLLLNLLEQKGMDRVLVFTNRKVQAERVGDGLQRHGVTAATLSGDVPQNKRMRILDDFREGRLRVLVATDVAARGLHIEGVTHVINFDFPYEPESYVHRIGRTGRAGALGTAISFACEDESFIIPEIEKFIGASLPCRQPEEALLKELPRPIHPAPHAEHRPAPHRPSRGGRPHRR